MKILSNAGIAIVVILFLLTFWILQVSNVVEAVPILKPLAQFPAKVGEWTLMNKREYPESVINMLKPEDYIDYTYAAPDGRAINLYVSYFNGKRGGYHSPRNCLPGSGWNITEIKPLTLNVRHSKTKPVGVNMMVIQKGRERQLSVYWFQNRGRIIASEYWEKIYLVMDSLLKGRRDGAFIRIMTPATDGDMKDTAASLENFSEKAFQMLNDFIPGADLKSPQ